jgi:hypothetical protein
VHNLMPGSEFEPASGLLVVVGPSGTIEDVNAAWTDFMARFDPAVAPSADVGADYRAFYAWWLAPEAGQSDSLAAALEDLLAGRRRRLSFRFRAAGPGDSACLFLVQGAPLRLDGVTRAVLVHNSVPGLRAVLDGAAWLDRECGTYPGMRALHDAAAGPSQFERLSALYDGILDRAILQRTCKVERSVSAGLRRLADELGRGNAGPRDLIDLHAAVFQKKSRGLASGSAMVLLEEARLALLELMGHLASYYRDSSRF